MSVIQKILKQVQDDGVDKFRKNTNFALRFHSPIGTMESANVAIKPKPSLFVISKRSDSGVRNRFNNVSRNE